MKLNGKVGTLTSLLFASFMLNPNLSAADPLESIEGILWPEIGMKNIQFLPDGHLHKNKPKYGKYNWEIKESPHFQIYTYGGNDRLATLYLENAEATYKEFSAKMNMNHFTEKIRVIIFNSSRDFEEASVIFGLVPKGLGGQTEMIKWKRVVVAFRDSPEGFKRLLKHELTHRYQGEFLKLTLLNFMTRDVPLWFTEGSAEHMAHDWDPRGELVMRDGYLNGYLAKVSKPSAWYTSLVYKQGEFILHFLAKEYKNKGEVISAILKDSAKMKFAKAFQKATGDTLEEFDKKLWQYIEKRYSPLRAKIDIADETKSVNEGTLLSAYGQFFITRKNVYGRETLFLNWTDSVNTKSKKLAEGGRLNNVDMRGFEVELSPEFGFQEHGASLASSNTLVYAMDAGGYDKIVVQRFSFDSEKKKIRLEEKNAYKFNGIREIQYPVMLNDQEVAFIGRDDGVFAELFVANLSSVTAQKLTSAQRTYRGLTYSKAYNSLVTSVENEATKSYDLALYNLAGNNFSYLTNTPENEFSAVCSPDGKQLLYVSDKGLIHNINRYNLASRTIEVLTDVRLGVFRPQWFDNGGLAFNWSSRGEISVKIAPLPKSLSAFKAVADSTHTAVSIWEIPEVQRMRLKIPNVESMTLFDAAVSSDKTKALFAENRKLSMEVLDRKDPEMRFHIVDSSTDSVITFTLDKFKEMRHYGAIAFLPGTNVLVQKHLVSKEPINDITNEQTRNMEEEVTYKESYIYDWKEQKLHEVDTEISSEYNGSNRSHSAMSPGRNYLIWSEGDKKKIFTYNIVTKEKKTLSKEFYEIQRAAFISDNKIMVLDKKWDFSLSILDISSDTEQTWDKIIAENLEFKKEVAWFPTEQGKKVFFVVPKKESGLTIFLFDADKSSITQIASDIPLVKKAELNGNTLELTITNTYGLDRTMVISSTGAVTITDEQFKYSVVHSTASAVKLNLDVFPRKWDFQNPPPSRTKAVSKVPKVIHLYGAAGASFGSGGFSSYLAMQMLAFDELSNKALGANIYLQNTDEGIANIQYYNSETGRSYILDYWNFDGFRQKLDVGISQNIFLHEFLNWDITFKQQKVKNQRENGTIEWWRTNVGTSLSLDTLVWDCEANRWTCHGPHSGAAVFTNAEIDLDNKRGFQAIDLNLDARYHIPFSDRTGLALRALAGKSLGPNPNSFIWGGNATFRGIPLFSQAGNSYVMQSSELRFPILNAAGAIFSGPIGEAFAPLTVYFDIRGGLYNDIGDIWYEKTPLFAGHQNFKMQQSAGYFINVPTILGLNLRFNKGLYGKQDWNFWLGYNW